jgi:uncharacterized protein YaeQ
MALKATIYKANLQIADIDHSYYADHAMTVARHPSETDERMMVRLLAFAICAHVNGGEGLELAKDIWDADEPALWQRDLTGAITQWIEVGQPDDKRILKACGKAKQVTVITFHHASDVWFKPLEGKIVRAQNLRVLQVPAEQSKELAALAERSMQLQFTIQEAGVMVSSNDKSVSLEFRVLKAWPNN